MNLELDFQIRQEHYKDLLKEAEQHRLLKNSKKSRKSPKHFFSAKRKSSQLERPNALKQALEGSS